MKEVVMTIVAAAAVVGIALTIAWSVNNTSRLYNEKVAACVQSGGTWIDYNSICISNSR